MPANVEGEYEVFFNENVKVTLSADQRQRSTLFRGQAATRNHGIQRNREGSLAVETISSMRGALNHWLATCVCCRVRRSRSLGRRVVRLILLLALVILGALLLHQVSLSPPAGAITAMLTRKTGPLPPHQKDVLMSGSETKQNMVTLSSLKPDEFNKTSLPSHLGVKQVGPSEKLPSPSPAPTNTNENTDREAALVTNTNTETPLPTPRTTMFTTTKQTRTVENPRAIKQQPVFRTPPLPASWAQGGGSVRVFRAFSVLTVVPGPPLTSEYITTNPSDRAVVLLRRAAHRLCTSGVAMHSSFYEWLIMHNTILAESALSAALEEEEAVRAWWTSATATDSKLETEQHKNEERTMDGHVLSRVRVVGLPQYTSANPYARKLAFALLYGMRLVLTEYVVVHDLHHVLISSVPSHALQYSTALASSPERKMGRSYVHEWVQRELTLALQALSSNAFHDLPYTLVDQARATASEDAIHAYRLQVYATVDLQDPVREAELQQQLVTFVKKIMVSTTHPAAKTNTDNENPQHNGEGTVTTALPTVQPVSGIKPIATVEAENELPVGAYSTASHFHCQRAPLYNVRVPVPSWLRMSHRQTADLTAAATAVVANTPSDVPLPPPPALSTLCEVLLSRRSGMPEAFAPQGAVFHRNFCLEWQQFTLLPSDSATSAQTTPSRRENPLVDAGQVVSGADRRGENRIGEDGNNNNNYFGDTLLREKSMVQDQGDGLCLVEWASHLKAAQLWYSEQAERRRRLGRYTVEGTLTAEKAESLNQTVAPPLRKAAVLMSNIAGPSPYLDQYAALLFSDNAKQHSRLTGTYLAFLPNATHALRHMRQTVEDKLNQISLKYATERARRFKSQKASTDREVVCLPSHLVRLDTQAALYNTQWFLINLVRRCLQHKEDCFGGFTEADERVTQNVNRYLSTTGKWSRGGFRVCMSGGVYVSDPSMQLPP